MASFATSAAKESPPSAKRLKISEEGDDNELVNDELMRAFEGDAKDDEEEIARARRWKRRQRWQKQHSVAPAVPHEATTVTDKPSTLVQNRETRSEQEVTAVEKVEAEDAFADRADVELKQTTTNGETAEEDDFDMFSSSVSPVVTKSTATANTKKDDFDDDEGYYKPVIGEIIDCSSTQYKVLGVVGKGVFSTVLKAKEQSMDKQVALKLIRNNDTMAKAALTEIRVLRKLSGHDHVVELIHPSSAQTVTEHHNHVVMCFPYQQYNLRDVLLKFGRGVGISLQSVQLYFPQLLSALRHLRNHQVLHCDIKPDNILVSADFSTLQLCDFGSATLLDEEGMIPTPYLVSRYYRAPEIILGAVPSFPLDLWSAAVTIVELFLGKVLFHGNSNNEMLFHIMQVLGPFSPRQIKQHVLQCKTHPGLPVQFEADGGAHAYFLQQGVDKATGTLVKKRILLQNGTFPTRPLQSILLKAKSVNDTRVVVLKFGNLLKGCLALDPTRRMDLRDAMHHEFFHPTRKTRGSGNDEETDDKAGGNK